jgi:hypothetical protein
MVSIRKPRSRLLTTVLFACLLVSGRTALATHAYEHDLAAVPSDCTVCVLGYAFKDDPVPGTEAPNGAVVHKIRSISGDTVTAIPTRSPYRARAPPTPIG